MAPAPALGRGRGSGWLDKPTQLFLTYFAVVVVLLLVFLFTHRSHRQPHVLDVAELLPGHLRIFSLARGSSLYKRALMYYSSKSKSDRNSVSESIQESYKRLREVRKEMKEIQRVRGTRRTPRRASQ